MRLTIAIPSLVLLLSLAPALRAQSLQDVRALVEAQATGAPTAAEALTRKAPGNAEAWLLLTRAYVQAGQSRKAITAGLKATQLAPRNAQAFNWLGNAYGTRIGEVGMLTKLTLAPKLRDAFEEAVRLDPALPGPRWSLIEFYLQAPAAMGGGIEKARTQAKAIGRQDKAKGLLAHARIAIHEEKPGEAIEAYEQAYVLKPRDEQVRMALISGYQATGRWKDALGAAKKWAVDEPGKAAAHYQLGRIAAESGQHLAEGEAGLRRFLTLARAPGDPEPKHARYRLGQVLAHAGRKGEARAELQAALKIDPGFREAKDALAKL